MALELEDDRPDWDSFHAFCDSKQSGLNGEEEIDDFLLSKGNKLLPVGDELQGLGVDRILVRNVGGLPYLTSVEYKTDYRAGYTGNLFIETQIRQRDGELCPGWLRKTIAQSVIFYLPLLNRLICLDVSDLRCWVLVHGKKCQHTKWVKNRGGYAGRGILLPMLWGKESMPAWLEMEMG